MTKRKTESQIVEILKEAEAGLSVQQICRQYGRHRSVDFL